MNLDEKIVNTLRCLSIDMVDSANSGHPGMPLGCAPIMFTLWCKIMKFTPHRDRFILSNGHGCALLYSILHLFGYYTIDDLKQFRQLHSKTPGHPEYNPELGIEVSTGPLGQGIANGVGMAIAYKKQNIPNHIFVMCGDGCIMEGITYEAASIAGHLCLNNLVLLYDDNGITIDGKVDITYSENTKDRFISMNWNVIEVLNGDSDLEDIYEKLLLSTHSTKPTIVFIKTTIGYGSTISGTSKTHGAPLVKEDIRQIKRRFGFDENKGFVVDDDVKEYFLQFETPVITKYVTQFTIDELRHCIKDGSTREMSSVCLDVIASHIDNLIIGSADLSESNKTNVKCNVITMDNYNGKIINYGIREHAMAGIANGLATCGILPIVSTFLVFITYFLAAIRMSALSNHKVIYILTHDSIFLGEDGPSHQPVESLTILRSIPNLLVFRPSDMSEVVATYQYVMSHNGPSCIILSRQTVPVLPSYIQDVSKGAYIMYEPPQVDFILIGTGSEVSLCIEISKQVKNIRVVSMPCCELFDKQPDEYKHMILPPHIKKISVEAGSTMGWYKYANITYGIDTFGASGNINDLRKHFKFTAEDIIKRSLPLPDSLACLD